MVDNGMSNLEKAYQAVEELTLEERISFIAALTARMSRVVTGIVHVPGVNGGRATIVRTRIPVWVLVSFRNQGANDAEILNHFPSLTAGDLVNAWDYYANHAEEIERDLAEQQEEE